ncbi:PaaI family thioesterase [Shimia sp. MMG029]|uniref:PaaI family thioesterase n=1 Tax=Shimia sp. MMG029 TaxID=3021978 RepID=UPI0022FE72B2|nr:PaaI family thioesterase [Shimia sp. MMG029]MDA5555481.1 PaaI family thioesterase [Shimia sp. MMG029]
MQAVMSAEEMTEFLKEVFPQVGDLFHVEHLDGVHTVMRMRITEENLRPGGTVSGPSMFTLADVAAYVATMARIGREALTVTTSCSLDFMRKPAAGKDLVAKAELLKLGKTMSVTHVLLFSEGEDEPVARANMTYAIPPKKMTA